MGFISDAISDALFGGKRRRLYTDRVKGAIGSKRTVHSHTYSSSYSGDPRLRGFVEGNMRSLGSFMRAKGAKGKLKNILQSTMSAWRPNANMNIRSKVRGRIRDTKYSYDKEGKRSEKTKTYDYEE